MNTYHLHHRDGHWTLTTSERLEPLARFITRPEAVLHASQFARGAGGTLQIHGRDGVVEEERRYPRPRPAERIPA